MERIASYGSSVWREVTGSHDTGAPTFVCVSHQRHHQEEGRLPGVARVLHGRGLPVGPEEQRPKFTGESLPQLV